VSLGTRFIVAEESMAPLAQKEMIIASTVDDIVFTDEKAGQLDLTSPKRYLQGFGGITGPLGKASGQFPK
jgi:hypothetical protein